MTKKKKKSAFMSKIMLEAEVKITKKKYRKVW